MMSKDLALVLLSGGLDSAVALYWAKEQGYRVETITFSYFRRSPRESLSCKKIARRAKVPNVVIDLHFLKEIDDSECMNPELNSAPSAYIPSRNIIFYGIASSIAEVINAKYIIGGHNANDVRSFPDSSKLFFHLFNKTASLGKISGGITGKVTLPLASFDKSQVVELGNSLGVPFQLTWSCYASVKNPCGKCPACVQRQTAFEKAGVEDPLRAET